MRRQRNADVSRTSGAFQMPVRASELPELSGSGLQTVRPALAKYEVPKMLR